MGSSVLGRGKEWGSVLNLDDEYNLLIKATLEWNKI